ncbi:hypothetical protein CK500_16615 [Halorubrum salipaludis]|uniref:GIY-YIG domain-containing protein n=1 Tax=Halorubrum salipaludis TaxID=2032630 RepID=A0A2A2EX26_9EURY|nr:GIY-YIG nuclease family protein [Halorubrum salipaludis]PAU77014.1 hypothetical protein CK500_16615 [Halorubrum salipaludis]
MKSDRIELPADKQLVEKVIQDRTEQGSVHFVYVLECVDWVEERARERVKDVYDLGTKEDLRFFQKDHKTDDPRHFQKNINNKNTNGSSKSQKQGFTERESDFNPPSWYYLALDAERVYYVGCTADVYSRINQHMEGKSSGGANFTTVFPPTHLVEVYGFQNKDRAYEAEREVGSELTENEEYAYFS